MFADSYKHFNGAKKIGAASSRDGAFFFCIPPTVLPSHAFVRDPSQGRRPDRTRVYDLYSYFRTVAANYPTIPEFFKQSGYLTAGMGKIFHPSHLQTCLQQILQEPYRFRGMQ